jgi:hypothetical protein
VRTLTVAETTPERFQPARHGVSIRGGRAGRHRYRGKGETNLDRHPRVDPAVSRSCPGASLGTFRRSCTCKGQHVYEPVKTYEERRRGGGGVRIEDRVREGRRGRPYLRFRMGQERRDVVREVPSERRGDDR